MMSRELDALVAEKVMGWKRPKRNVAGATWYTPEGYGSSFTGIPQYTNHIAEDYLVLKHVRENWDSEKKSRFEFELHNLLNGKSTQSEFLAAARYEPGDYSMAALKALEK